MRTAKIRNTDYIINELGQITSPRGNVISTWVEKNTGYRLFRVFVNNKSTCYRLHRILGECFIPNPDNLPYVKHKDDDKSNNSLDNLEWGTSSSNAKEGYDNGCYTSKKRSHAVIATHKHTKERQEFKSIRQLSEALGLNRKTVAALLKDPTKTNAYDYTFEYNF